MFSRQQIQDALKSQAIGADLCESILKQLSAPGSSTPKTAAIEGAAIDLDRSARVGFPEVVFAEGKPAELVVEILKRQLAAGQYGFATRVSAEQADAVAAEIPSAVYSEKGRTIRVHDADLSQRPVTVAVVTAGSCDAPVAAEATETLKWMGVHSVFLEDIGVAGPQRLLTHVEQLQSMKAIVCIAGMEAALPSVVGGHVSCPVIGVPTSVGYGASFGGLTAMLSMLTCCASNVVTVNIDAGFRGGYVAGMIARQSQNVEKSNG